MLMIIIKIATPTIMIARKLFTLARFHGKALNLITSDNKESAHKLMKFNLRKKKNLELKIIYEVCTVCTGVTFIF